MVSRRSSSSVKRRSAVTRQNDTPKARKLRVIADPNGITVPAKIVRVKKGRKRDIFPMDDCSMELDEANSTSYGPKSVGSSVGSAERIPELPRNVSLSTMSGAHHFGVHGGEIMSAGGDIHINKYSPPNAERSMNRIPTTSSSESEISMSQNATRGANGSITDLQFPNVIQTLSSYLQGIKRQLIPSLTTVDDIMHSPVFLVDFPTTMIPEDTQTYSRFMLQFRQGYPLYRSAPIGVSETHWKKGVRVGDVGRVRPDGSFEFLFNIDPNETDTWLPDGFEKLHRVDSFREPDYYSKGEHLLKGSVEQTRNSPMTYKFSASGAILQLPEGAIHFEAQNKNDFSSFATRYAQRWYKYMNVDRSMGAPNGSLYLITGCIKCTGCATAIFSEPHIGENWLEFHHEGLRARPRYMWRKMGPMTTRVNQNQEDLGIIDVEEPRHCVFIRGFKITLGDKEWKQLIKIAVTQYSSQDTFVEGSGSSGASWFANHAAKDGNDTSRQYTNSDSVSDNNGVTESSPIIQQLSSSASPMHPSDFINAILLQRHPEAKVAVTHDDDWLDLFAEDHSVDPFNLPVDALLKILDEVDSTVDKHGCVSLVKTTQQDPAQRSTNLKTAITRSNEKGHKALPRIGKPTSHPTASRAIHKSAPSFVSKDWKLPALQETTEPHIGHRLSTRESDGQISNEVKNNKGNFLLQWLSPATPATFSATAPRVGGATFGMSGFSSDAGRLMDPGTLDIRSPAGNLRQTEAMISPILQSRELDFWPMPQTCHAQRYSPHPSPYDSLFHSPTSTVLGLACSDAAIASYIMPPTPADALSRSEPPSVAVLPSNEPWSPFPIVSNDVLHPAVSGNDTRNAATSLVRGSAGESTEDWPHITLYIPDKPEETS